jgi:hypothetical protein
LSGDLPAAARAYEDASKRAPDNLDIHYCLSKVLENGAAIAPKAELQRFIELEPESDAGLSEARDHLAGKTQ